MKLILLSTDLMISSLVTGAARQHGLEVVTASNQAAALTAAKNEQPRVLVIDLRCPGLGVSSLMASLREDDAKSIPVVAFGPHVHEASLQAAREAGCDVVATRGQFDREAPAILGQLLKS